MDEARATPLSVYEHISVLLEAMVQVAWQKMGLRPDPVSGTMQADLTEAKIAIDLVAHLVGILEPNLDAEDRRQIQNVLRDLRVNYVQKNTEVLG